MFLKKRNEYHIFTSWHGNSLPLIDRFLGAEYFKSWWLSTEYFSWCCIHRSSVAFPHNGLIMLNHCFLSCQPEKVVEQTVELPMIWSTLTPMRHHYSEQFSLSLPHGRCHILLYRFNLVESIHDDVIKWKHFPRYSPFVRVNSPVTGEFRAQRPMTRSVDVFFDLRLNKRLSKQSWGWWFETLSRPLCRHCNEWEIINNTEYIFYIFQSIWDTLRNKLHTMQNSNMQNWETCNSKFVSYRHLDLWNGNGFWYGVNEIFH